MSTRTSAARDAAGSVRRRSVARDAALRRLSRSTAVLATVTAGTIGAVTLFVANALPGRALTPSGTPAGSAGGTSTGGGGTSTGGGGTSTGDTGAPSVAPTTSLAPPPTVPQPVYRRTYRAPVIVSSSTGY